MTRLGWPLRKSAASFPDLAFVAGASSVGRDSGTVAARQSRWRRDLARGVTNVRVNGFDSCECHCPHAITCCNAQDFSTRAVGAVGRGSSRPGRFEATAILGSVWQEPLRRARNSLLRAGPRQHPAASGCVPAQLEACRCSGNRRSEEQAADSQPTALQGHTWSQTQEWGDKG